MKQNFLEHQKAVFENISWKDEIFYKEIAKSREWLNDEEFQMLELWLQSRFNIKINPYSEPNADKTGNMV